MNGCRVILRIKTPFPVKNLLNSPYPVRNFSLTPFRNLKLIQFTYHTQPNDIKVGFLSGDTTTVIDISKLDSSLSPTLLGVLRNGELEKVKQLKKKDSVAYRKAEIKASKVNIKAPLYGMDKILCVGLNYNDLCQQQFLLPPEIPMIFNKFPSCIIGPNEAVKLRTDVTQNVDWEVEMCVVIGKTASSIKAADARNYIAGITVSQDISARDWQGRRNGGQYLLGKAMDGFCPIGPCMATLEQVGNFEKLDIRCSINGNEMQSSNTSNHIHKVADLIERITSVMTLLPGDLLMTGTPGGVGMYRNPPQYLQPGDVVSSEIEKVGTLRFKIEKF